MTHHARIPALLAVLSLTACSHAVPVAPDQLPELATYGADERATIRHDDREIEITADNDPVLVLKLRRSCSFWDHLGQSCDKLLTGPLGRVEMTDSRLTIQQKTSAFLGHYEAHEVDLDEVEEAELQLEGYIPEGWRPHWGVGLTVAGPSLIAAAHLQWFPAEALALEVGALPAADLMAVYGGLRIRPFAFGIVRPFLGTWINYIAAFDPVSSESQWLSNTGARVGLDLELASRRWLVTVEFDLARTLNEDRVFVADLEGEWIPWGGMSTAVLF